MTDTLAGIGVRVLPSTGQVTDALARPLRDLRVSVTDRCNFRCVYCMPREVFGRDYAFLERDQLLSFEEIARVVRSAVALGVEKVRLTGGEPLLRKGIVDLVAQLRELRTPGGQPLDLALTTNGSALAVLAEPLAAAGLNRVTVSLDSLDDATFRRMNDVNFPVARVLAGIEAAREAGLGPVKVNTVVTRSQNDADVLDLARYFRGTDAVLRYIEYMDVGSTNGWKLDEVVPSAELVGRIDAVFPLERMAATAPGETSTRYRYRDGAGEIGFISSVSQAFCGSCNRARLSTEGALFTCLFASAGHDLRSLLRGGCSDSELHETLRSIWQVRDDRYSEERSSLTPELRGARRHVEMSYIGG